MLFFHQNTASATLTGLIIGANVKIPIYRKIIKHDYTLIGMSASENKQGY